MKRVLGCSFPEEERSRNSGMRNLLHFQSAVCRQSAPSLSNKPFGAVFSEATALTFLRYTKRLDTTIGAKDGSWVQHILHIRKRQTKHPPCHENFNFRDLLRSNIGVFGWTLVYSTSELPLIIRRKSSISGPTADKEKDRLMISLAAGIVLQPRGKGRESSTVYVMCKRTFFRTKKSMTSELATAIQSSKSSNVPFSNKMVGTL